MKEVKHKIMLVQILFGDEFIIMVERLDVHSFIYSCLQLSICSAYAERGTLLLMYRVCSRNLDFNFQLVCPTYALWEVLHVILYIPLFSCSCNRVGAMGFMRWCNVFVVLNAMPIFVFFKKLVIFLDLWSVEGKCCPDFFVILASFFVVGFVYYLSVKLQ